jgi:hypothetical protein
MSALFISLDQHNIIRVNIIDQFTYIYTVTELHLVTCCNDTHGITEQTGILYPWYYNLIY